MNGIAFPPGRGGCLAPAETSSGVRCDENGPSVGPVRLLRRTPFGFEPRPQPELDFIFGKTFGAPVDWHKRMPDLVAISEALDRNELALAAIMTLHMRLPEISDAQVQRARHADRFVKASFDPDEPRDARGRWTSGGAIVIPPHELSAGDQSFESGPSFQVADNDLEKFRDMKCQEFISAFCRGNIRSVFPGQYLDLSVGTVLQDARGGSAAALTAQKLLSRPEYLK